MPHQAPHVHVWFLPLPTGVVTGAAARSAHHEAGRVLREAGPRAPQALLQLPGVHLHLQHLPDMETLKEGPDLIHEDVGLSLQWSLVAHFEALGMRNAQNIATGGGGGLSLTTSEEIEIKDFWLIIPILAVSRHPGA